MYLPTRPQDIDEYEAGRMGVNELLQRSGVLPPTDKELDNQVVEIEGTLFVEKKIGFIAKNITMFKWFKKNVGSARASRYFSFLFLRLKRMLKQGEFYLVLYKIL